MQPVNGVINGFRAKGDSQGYRIACVHPLLRAFNRALRTRQRSLNRQEVFGSRGTNVRVQFNLALRMASLLGRDGHAYGRGGEDRRLGGGRHLSSPITSLSIRRFATRGLQQASDSRRPKEVGPCGRHASSGRSNCGPPGDKLRGCIYPRILPYPTVSGKWRRFRPTRDCRHDRRIRRAKLGGSLGGGLATQDAGDFARSRLPSALRGTNCNRIRNVYPACRRRGNKRCRRGGGHHPTSFRLFLMYFLQDGIGIFRQSRFCDPNFVFRYVDLMLIKCIARDLFGFSQDLSKRRTSMDVCAIGMPSILPFLKGHVMKGRRVMVRIQASERVNGGTHCFGILL